MLCDDYSIDGVVSRRVKRVANTPLFSPWLYKSTNVIYQPGLSQLLLWPQCRALKLAWHTSHQSVNKIKELKRIQSFLVIKSTVALYRGSEVPNLISALHFFVSLYSYNKLPVVKRFFGSLSDLVIMRVYGTPKINDYKNLLGEKH